MVADLQAAGATVRTSCGVKRISRTTEGGMDPPYSFAFLSSVGFFQGEGFFSSSFSGSWVKRMMGVWLTRCGGRGRPWKSGSVRQMRCGIPCS
jgi:hypothetical protein